VGEGRSHQLHAQDAQGEPTHERRAEACAERRSAHPAAPFQQGSRESGRKRKHPPGDYDKPGSSTHEAEEILEGEGLPPGGGMMPLLHEACPGDGQEAPQSQDDERQGSV
jgi:hypothetical protein